MWGRLKRRAGGSNPVLSFYDAAARRRVARDGRLQTVDPSQGVPFAIRGNPGKAGTLQLFVAAPPHVWPPAPESRDPNAEFRPQAWTPGARILF